MAHVNPTFEPDTVENGVAVQTIAEGKDGDNNSSTEEDGKETKEGFKAELLYTIDQTPPWYTCIILGLQHYLTMFGATFAIPLIVAPSLCIGDDMLATSEILGTILFVSGIVTILQATFGNRLPIVQGGSFAFLAPIFAILALDQWKCPPVPGNYTVNNVSTDYYGSAEHRVVWTDRMREIQGAIIGASFFEVLIGATGLVGLCLRFITPLSIAPTIALVGMSLFGAAANFASRQWWIALMTIVLIIIFSQYMRNIQIPICSCNKGCKDLRCSGKLPLFKMFPIIMGVVLSWLICAILTAANVLPNDSKEWGYYARTDTKIEVLYKAKWFRFPYPAQWGLPTFSVAGVFGMLAGTIAGMMESIGDYYACARLAGAPPPPVHAVNRGVFVEGLGCIFSGLWGTGSGTTSYSENIGAIGLTKVASRRVIQVGGVVFIFFGLFAKFGALFVSLPDPIVGGVFMVMFGMIAAVGISNLQFVDMNSSRNLFIFGFSLFFGLSMPNWMSNNTSTIKTGNSVVDQIFTVLLSTSMFVGGVVAIILDNTVPGTDEERGVVQWRAMINGNASLEDAEGVRTYDFPFGMNAIRKANWLRFIPLCPTYKGWGYKKRANSVKDEPEVIVKAPSSNGENVHHRKSGDRQSPPPKYDAVSSENRNAGSTDM